MMMNEQVSDTNVRPEWLIPGLLAIIVLAGLYVSSVFSYLLFHSLVEIFGVIITFTIFVLAWNTRRVQENSFFLFLGLSAIFGGVLQMLHTLTYRGMAVLPGFDADLPTQLWIAFRAVAAVSFLLATFFIRRTLRPFPVVIAYSAVTLALLWAIFSGHFPACYVEGSGLTKFKVLSEYAIMLVFLAALGRVIMLRAFIDPGVLRYAVLMFSTAVLCELFFTQYVSVFGQANKIGHFFLLISEYFLYRALVVTGIADPSRILFLNLQQREKELAESTQKYQALFDNMLDGFAYLRVISGNGGRGIDYEFLEVNDAFVRLTGRLRRDVIGRTVRQAMPEVETDAPGLIDRFDKMAAAGGDVRFEQHIAGTDRWYSIAAYSPKPGYVATILSDISERVRAEERLAEALAVEQTSAAEMETIFAGLSDGVLVFDEEMTARRANPAIDRSFGFDPQGMPAREIMARLKVRMIDGRPIPEQDQALARALTGNTAIDRELCFTRSDGEERTVEISAAPLKIGDRVSGAVIVYHDTTERGRSRQRLRRSVRRFELLSRITSDLLSSQEPRRIVDAICRQVMEHLDCQACFNYLTDEQTGKLHLNVCIGVPPEAVGRIEWLDIGEAVCGAVARDGVRVVEEGIQSSAGERTSLVRSLGIRAYACHPIKGQDGMPLGTLSFGSRAKNAFDDEDLSLMEAVADQVAVAIGRLKAEEQLRSARDEAERERIQLDAILNTIPSGVALFDRDTKQVVLQNRQVEELFGESLGSRDQETRRRRFNMTKADGEPFALDELPGNIAIRTGAVVKSVEMLVTRPDGRRVTILSHAAPMRDANGIVNGAVVVLHDITERKETETALRLNEQRLSAIFNGVNESLIMLDVEGRILALNETAALRFNRRPTDLVGENALDLMPGEVRERRHAKIRELANTGVPVYFHDERDDMHFEHSLYPIRNDQGEIGQLIVFSRDVTALHESERKYRMLFENMAEGFALYEMLYDDAGVPCDWRILEINDAYSHHTGIEREKVIGRRASEMYPDAYGQYLPRFARVVASRQPEEFETYSQPVGRYLHITTFPAGKDRFAATILNISDRKESEERVRHFASFPMLNPDPVLELNTEGNILFVNPAAQRTLERTGYNPAEAERFLPGDMAGLLQDWDRKTERTVVREISLGGRYFNTTVQFAPQFNVARVYAFDITRRKEAEAQLREAHDEMEQRVRQRTVQLEEQARRLDAFFSHSSSPLVFLDREFNFLRVNEAYARSCGRQVEDFIGRNHFVEYPSADLQGEFERVVRDGYPYAAIARPFAFPDHPEWGITYWDLYVNPILDAHGEAEFLVFALNDVTDQTNAIRSLRASEERYRSMFDHSMDAILLTEADGRILEANAAASRLLGWSAEELCGMRQRDIEEAPDAGDDATGERQKPAASSRGEALLRCADGMRLTAVLSISGFSDPDGNARTLVIIHDITERQRAEEELRRSEVEIRDLYNNAPCGYHSADREGTIIRINNTALDWLGYTRDEIVGRKKVTDLCSPESGRRYEARFSSLLARGWIWNEELEWVRKDGTTVPVLMNSTAIYDKHGAYVMSRSTTFDISYRKKAEQERARLASVVESTADGVIVADHQGTILYTNAAYEALSGYRREEVEGTALDLLSTDRYPGSQGDALRETIRSAGAWQGQIMSRRKDGSQFIEDCSLSVVRDGAGAVMNYVAIIRDVTERLRLESIAASVNSMSNIGYVFAGVRHEIGNPINSAKSILAVLDKKLNSAPVERIREYLEHARKEIGRVEHVLGSLKSYSLYEKPDIREIDAGEVVNEISRLIEGDLRDKGIDFSRVVEPGAGTFRADPRALHQVLLNFITNAVDALAGRPHPRIAITVSRARDRVAVTVHDNGSGMTEKQLADLFKPFYTSKAHGTGLGMVIAKKMITLMGGDISVISTFGSGTEVTITLEGENHDQTR